MIKSYLFSQFWRLIILLMIIVVLIGCGAAVREQFYAPIVSNLEDMGTSETPYEIARNEKYWRASFNTKDAVLTVFPVDFSEKMTMLFGPLIIIPTPLAENKISDKPLSIKMRIDIQKGTASFDPQDCVVFLGENRQVLAPISVKKTIYYKDKRNSESEEVTGVVTMTDQFDFLFITFTYDILRTNLSSFGFQFSRLEINGNEIRFQELPFKLKSGYSSR